MSIKPLNNRVIIKPEKKREKLSATGIITSSAYDKTEELHGSVVAIGPEVKQVAVGDLVSFPAYGYESVSDLNFNDFMSVREPEIVAVIERLAAPVKELDEVILPPTKPVIKAESK